RGLTREQLSIPARIMGIADVFEALIACDRPYKKGKMLSECLKIMKKMKQAQHLDPDLFDVFIREKVYLDYAKKFVASGQIDQVCEADILGQSSGLYVH
ncbi:MAG: phosphohydrolase, partial [Mariprofundaceae bacterium]|nr:phosphohydrolase [Mariprofundaceae bacterium]